MKASKVFEFTLAACLIILGIYAGLSEGLTIPGRVSIDSYYIKPPSTLFISGSIFCFAGTLILSTLNKNKKARIVLLVSSFALFTIGLISGIN